MITLVVKLQNSEGVFMNVDETTTTKRNVKLRLIQNGHVQQPLENIGLIYQVLEAPNNQFLPGLVHNLVFDLRLRSRDDPNTGSSSSSNDGSSEGSSDDSSSSGNETVTSR